MIPAWGRGMFGGRGMSGGILASWKITEYMCMYHIKENVKKNLGAFQYTFVPITQT